MGPEIVVKRPGVEPPALAEGGLRYLLARDGLYLERRTALYHTSTRLTGPLLGLAAHEVSCQLFFPPLPRVLVRAMLTFFKAAYDLHGGEAALVLLYHPGTGAYRWHCPPQTVEVYRSFGRLRAYDAIAYELPLELPEGYVVFGDAHSHGSMPAYASAVDKHDEEHKDGLHLIVGRIDEPGRYDYHADFVMDGQRFGLDPAAVLEDMRCRPFARPPAPWLERITMKQPSWWTTNPWVGSYRDEDGRRGNWGRSRW